MKIPPHQRLTLANGVKLLLLPRHEVPLIAFDAVVRGGARLDPAAQGGVASVTAELLTRGAGDRDSYAFADAVEGAGGSLEAGAHAEAIALHGQFLSRDSGLMLELLADALQRPRFEPEELEGVLERRIEFIKAAKDSEPQSLIGYYGRSLLFGSHPFGKPIGGSEKSLAQLTAEDLKHYYRQHIGADRLTLVFAGDFDPPALQAAIASRFGGWESARAPLPPLPSPERAHGRRVLLVDAPGSAQTYFWIGNVGVARSFPLRAALEVTATAFGGSFGSMLMQALRVKHGLTYSASSSFRRGSVPGEFAIGSFTETEATAQAVTIALETLDALKRDGAGARSLESAKSYILGQYPLSLETSADWAAALADLDLYDLPDSHIDDFTDTLRAVDESQSRAVIDSAFPDSSNVDIVLIGDAARIRAEAAAFGPVIEKSLAAPDFQIPAQEERVLAARQDRAR
jgi:zinc protease